MQQCPETRRFSMRKRGLLIKFGLLFAAVILLAVVMNYSCATLLSKRYVLEEKQTYIKSILDLVAHTMEESGEETLAWAKYCQEHGKDMDIRYEQEEDGETEGSKMEQITEKWVQYFSYALDNYGLKYMYFVRISSENDIVYIADGKPEDAVRDGEFYRFTGDVDHYEQKLEESNPVIWKLWNSGSKADIECELSDTEYGYTYRLWCPVVVNGEVAGLLGANIDVSRVDAEIRESTFPIALWSCMFFAILLVLILIFLKQTIVKKIITLDRDVIRYSETKAPETADIIAHTAYGGDEIGSLAENFAGMIRSLHQYMSELNRVTAEKERIGAELDVAKNIQASMLPCIFPAFPGRKEFDIYASMKPAKEVGGDFYDFFLVDEDHLVLIMADVSGKGVPAALFMVIAKTLLKNCAQTGMMPGAVLEKVNNQLCENNDAQMFVTVWMGILEISTGKMVCANAGHDQPAVMHRDGDFKLVQDVHGFVLAGMEDMTYKEYGITLEAGDKLYLYTDGVPEAVNKSGEFYGMDRMVRSLNRNKEKSPEELLEAMKQDIREFSGEAEQFDDITMLAAEIKGRF